MPRLKAATLALAIVATLQFLLILGRLAGIFLPYEFNVVVDLAFFAVLAWFAWTLFRRQS